MKRQVLTLCLGAMLWAGLCAASTKDITITDPRIPERPPVAKMLAAYLTITNTAATPAQLLSVASPDFKQIEIHQEGFQRNFFCNFVASHQGILKLHSRKLMLA